MAAHTGLEPVISALRGQRVNQLHQCAARGLDYRDGMWGAQVCCDFWRKTLFVAGWQPARPTLRNDSRFVLNDAPNVSNVSFNVSTTTGDTSCQETERAIRFGTDKVTGMHE